MARECAFVEDIIRQIVHQNNIETQGKPSFDESPLKPWIIEMAKTVLVYHTETSSCLYGATRGHGVVLKRLPSSHPSLIKWSAPLFVKIRLQGGGLMFGSQHRSAFAVCTTDELEHMLVEDAHGHSHGYSVRGIEFVSSCGSGMNEKTDLISVPFGKQMDVVSVSQTSGAILGFGYMTGALVMDREKNEAMYGCNVRVDDVFDSDVIAPPPEFQPLYGELNRIVNRVEKVSVNPARVSASLERFSSGKDPERVLVLDDGSMMM